MPPTENKVRHDRSQNAPTGNDVQQRLRSLSPRQQEVCDLMVRGEPTGAIAARLGISTNTVKTHRMHILRRMGAASVIELANLLLDLQLRVNPQVSGTRAAEDASGSVAEAGPPPAEAEPSARPTLDRDPLTGLQHIDELVEVMEAQLRLPVDSGGVLAQVRVDGLRELNHSHGRKLVDALLMDAGRSLRQLVSSHWNWFAARRAGPDFILLAPGAILAENVARDLQNGLHRALIMHDLQTRVRLPCAAARYSGSDTLPAVLARLDSALQRSERHGFSCISVAD